MCWMHGLVRGLGFLVAGLFWDQHGGSVSSITGGVEILCAGVSARFCRGIAKVMSDGLACFFYTSTSTATNHYHYRCYCCFRCCKQSLALNRNRKPGHVKMLKPNSAPSEGHRTLSEHFCRKLTAAGQISVLNTMTKASFPSC